MNAARHPLWKRLALWLGVIDHPDEPTWFPVWLHSAGAAGIVLALVVVGVSPILATLANAAWWGGREVWQARGLGKSLNPGEWSQRKFAELVVPAAIGGLVAPNVQSILETMMVVR